MEPLKALREAISEVLEIMCFLCPVPLKEPPRDLQGRLWEAVEVKFQGESSGSLRMFFPVGLTEEMTRSLTGDSQQELDRHRVWDALKEVTNMVAGGLLHRLDPQAGSTLMLPEILPQGTLWEPSKCLAMDLDGEMLLAELDWKGSALQDTLV